MMKISATKPSSTSSRFNGMIDSPVDSSDNNNNDTMYKHYIQVIYTPVSVNDILMMWVFLDEW